MSDDLLSLAICELDINELLLEGDTSWWAAWKPWHVDSENQKYKKSGNLKVKSFPGLLRLLSFHGSPLDLGRKQ